MLRRSPRGRCHTGDGRWRRRKRGPRGPGGRSAAQEGGWLGGCWGEGGPGWRARVAREEGVASGLRSRGGLVSFTSSPRPLIPSCPCARDCEGSTWEMPGGLCKGGDAAAGQGDGGRGVGWWRAGGWHLRPWGRGVPAHQPGQKCQQLIPSETQAELSRGSRSHCLILRKRKAEAAKAGGRKDGGLTPSHVWVHQVES